MKRIHWALLGITALVVASCSAGTADTTVTTPTAPPAPTTTATALDDTTLAATGRDVESYLVEMTNLAFDVDGALRDFECSYNDEWAPGLCAYMDSGGFCETGEECEPPPTPAEDEMFDYTHGLFLGRFSVYLAHTDALAG